MKRIILLLLLLSVYWHANAEPGAGTTTHRVLIVGSSSMPVAAGKATLIVGELRFTNGVYAGEYKIKVFPYFYKNESGRISIIVTDEASAAVARGAVASITGTAISAKSGHIRTIMATVTPQDINGGKLSLWFTAGNRKMTFEPDYHFVGLADTDKHPAMKPTELIRDKKL